MARIPLFEDALPWIHEKLGLGLPGARRARHPGAPDFPSADGGDAPEALLGAIFATLGFDARECDDAVADAMAWIAFERELAAHAWTREASQAQVLWHMLAFAWVPGLARILAGWSLTEATHPERVMTAERLPLLPQPDPDSGEWRLPPASPAPDGRLAALVLEGCARLEHVLSGAMAGPERAGSIRVHAGSLLRLFRTIHDRSIESARHEVTIEAQDRWFESGFAQWEREALLLAIMPSHRERAAADLGGLLSRRFADLASDAPLQDLVCTGEPQHDATVAAQHLQWIEAAHRDAARARQLEQSIPAAPPWPALQQESDFAVVKRLAHATPFGTPIHDTILERLRELARTPGRLASVRMSELEALLLCRPGARRADARERSQALLDNLEQRPGFEVWKGPLLWLRARHRLYQNDLDGAGSDYRAMLQACQERQYGAFRFIGAQEALAVDVVRHGFAPRRQAVYLRHLRQSPAADMMAPAFEEEARNACELFWTRLYQPYAGVPRVEGQMTEDARRRLGQSIDLAQAGDLRGLRAWLIKFERSFRQAAWRDAAQDSVLVTWIQQLQLAEESAMSPMPRSAGIADAFDRMRVRTRGAAALLVEMWPEHARIPDFKGRTPLMLAAKQGDAELVRLLAPLSDIDAQDCIGRTALHAAVASGAADCVAALLEHAPDGALTTYDNGHNALHTAARSGHPQAVALVAAAFPALAGEPDFDGITPAQAAALFVQRYLEWREETRGWARPIGSQADFDAVAALLRSTAG